MIRTRSGGGRRPVVVDRWDACIVVGGMLLATGCALWSLPFGLVVAGVELLAVGVIGARAFPEQPTPSHEPRALEG